MLFINNYTDFIMTITSGAAMHTHTKQFLLHSARINTAASIYMHIIICVPVSCTCAQYVFGPWNLCATQPEKSVSPEKKSVWLGKWFFFLHESMTKICQTNEYVHIIIIRRFFALFGCFIDRMHKEAVEFCVWAQVNGNDLWVLNFCCAQRTRKVNQWEN